MEGNHLWKVTIATRLFEAGIEYMLLVSMDSVTRYCILSCIARPNQRMPKLSVVMFLCFSVLVNDIASTVTPFAICDKNIFIH